MLWYNWDGDNVKSELIEDTYDIINCIKEDPRYKRLIELEDSILDLYKDEIDDFNSAKEKYYEALKYGKYHPSLSDYEKELSKKKALLYNKDLVKEYNRLYREIQNEIDKIINKIKSSVSKAFYGGNHECKK